MNGFVIAIDGPSGTGKSTTARGVARALRAGYLDTGALYRIVTLHVLDRGIDPEDAAAVADSLRELTFDSPTDPDDQRQVLAGRDVSARIRDGDVTTAVSPVSANPAVRAFLLERQQRLARSGRMVVEGRDIGTVIVPDAEVKIYLTADAGVRARRRQLQDQATKVAAGPVSAGASVSADRGVAEVAADLARRDRHDSSRAHAPLRSADDAVVVDSTHLSIEQTIEAVVSIAREKGVR